MDRKRLGAFLCGVVFCMMAVLVQLTPVLAAELADPDRQVCLTVETRQNGKPVGGMELSLYRVAQMDEKGQFTLLEQYQASGAAVDGLTSASQWNQAAKTLADFAAQNSLPADVLIETGTDGVCTADGLESGLYLVTSAELETAEGRYRLDPFLTALPMLEDAVWNYAPTVLPKILFTEVPVTPTPSTPVSPEPSSPVSPEPTSPVSPEPSAPVSPEPSGPVSPKPSAPVSPEPSSPVSPEPSSPVSPEPSAPVSPEPSSSASPEPSSSASPEPSSSAAPSPSGQPTVSPAPSPGANGGLPQTGQLNWPIPVLALIGMALAAAGCLLRRRHE